MAITGVAIASANSAVGLNILTLAISLTTNPFLGSIVFETTGFIAAYFSVLTDVAIAISLILICAYGLPSCSGSAVAAVHAVKSGCNPQVNKSPPALITP